MPRPRPLTPSPQSFPARYRKIRGLTPNNPFLTPLSVSFRNFISGMLKLARYMLLLTPNKPL
jgi:hypothetical protein